MEDLIMLETNYNYIIYKFEDGIGTITLNRPNQLNALQYPLIMEIIVLASMHGIDIEDAVKSQINFLETLYGSLK